MSANTFVESVLHQPPRQPIKHILDGRMTGVMWVIRWIHDLWTKRWAHAPNIMCSTKKCWILCSEVELPRIMRRKVNVRGREEEGKNCKKWNFHRLQGSKTISLNYRNFIFIFHIFTDFLLFPFNFNFLFSAMKSWKMGKVVECNSSGGKRAIKMQKIVEHEMMKCKVENENNFLFAFQLSANIPRTKIAKSELLKCKYVRKHLKISQSFHIEKSSLVLLDHKSSEKLLVSRVCSKSASLTIAIYTRICTSWIVVIRCWTK